jgi:ribosomal protein L12E/L44/L45/RPP1/RPP2
MQIRHILAALTVACVSAVSAQTLTGIKVEPAQITAGQSVKLTADLEAKGNQINCGLLIVWGDGATSSEKITSERDIPRVATHTYAKAGNYTVSVEPTKAGSSLKCLGKDMKATVAVAAAPVAAAPAAAPVAAAAAKPAAQAADLCPADWKLAKPGMNKKTKAFTCTAKPNTKLPDAKVSCPGDLTYFENAKKGQLGCRV